MARNIDGHKFNIVGDNIRKLRIKNNLSQKELSEKLELSAVYICRGSISRIEDHLRTVTDVELKAFAEIFHVSVDSLYE